MAQNELLDGTLVTVVMADSDWADVIEAMEYLSGFSSTPLSASPEELGFIGESIQDVLDGAR